MKRIIVLCLLLVVTMPLWSSAAAIGPARVRFIEGEAMFLTPDTDEWLPAAVNTPLEEGDALWCPTASRAEIQLPDGSIVRLDGGTHIDLLANEDGFIHLHLAKGRLYLRSVRGLMDNSLQVDADDTTVLPSGRTRLHIDMLPNGHEDVAIIKGSAYVEGNGNRTRVRAGEHILLEDGYNEILPLNPADSWELWNRDRDREQSRSIKADSPLPEELQGYSAELDANGTWVSVPEYGMVWRPAVIASRDWAPYREGRWIWRGDDYIWLPLEPWGWVPYHFGRWAVVSGFGWCWVPPVRGDVYWGPGYVGWYRTGSHVGWTPLAPGETFYGRGNYGRHSVNIKNTGISTGNVVYRNRSNPGGITMLPHNDFLKGRPAGRQPSGNVSVSASVSVGAPRIQPVRETRMPLIKQTPPRVAPPRIEHRDSRELRGRFPRVTPVQATERVSRQPAPAVSAPVPAAVRIPRVEEKRGTSPSVLPAERTPQPDRQKPQTIAPQREERRERAPQPQKAPQAAPPVPLSQPQASGSPAQRNNQQPRGTVAPADSQNRQPLATPKGDSRQATTAVPAPVRPLAAPSQQTEKQGKGQPGKDMRQRKVWRVTTSESVPEKEPVRERDNRGKEHR